MPLWGKGPEWPADPDTVEICRDDLKLPINLKIASSQKGDKGTVLVHKVVIYSSRRSTICCTLKLGA